MEPSLTLTENVNEGNLPLCRGGSAHLRLGLKSKIFKTVLGEMLKRSFI